MYGVDIAACAVRVKKCFPPGRERVHLSRVSLFSDPEEVLAVQLQQAHEFLMWAATERVQTELVQSWLVYELAHDCYVAALANMSEHLIRHSPRGERVMREGR